jgi:diguanylate cyclase (GGDEF)-like protein
MAGVVLILAALGAPLWSPYAAVGVTLAVLAVLAVVIRISAHQIVSRDLRVARMLSERRDQAYEVAVERAQLSAQLAHSASHDRLTKLINRAAFIERVGLSLAGETRDDGRAVPVTILVLDISRFAGFNESLGPELSDELLVRVSERIIGALRPGDVLARTDGDVFAALLETVPPQSAGEVAQRLLRAIRASYDVDGRTLAVTFSCGLATAMPGEGVDASEILRRADVALQNAKATRHAYVTFEPRIEEETAHRRRFDEDLRNALPGRELHLAYQPLVDTHTGEVHAVEALMRWEHPHRGAVSPAEFIPVAESSGDIVDMGLWALTEACRQQREWRDRHAADIVMAVNFSARQLSEPDVIERVRAVVLRQAVDPRRLKLEITESLLVEDMTMAVDVLTRLRGLGLRLSIDDFGTGYSSLSRLGELPIDEIKIDKFFVDGIGKRGTRETILNAAIAMGHGLGLTVVAEGVETLEQLDYLRAHNCDYSQGFLLSRPVDPARALGLLRVPLARRHSDDLPARGPVEEQSASAVPSVLPSLEPRPTPRLFAR